MTTDVALHHENGAVLALPTVTGGDLPGLAVLEQWSNANDHATRLVAQWIFTDLVPVHHWPMPPGQTLKTFPNPRMYGPNETDEQYQRRCQIAAASAAGTVLRGIPLGLPPNISLEQMASIRGTITMKTRLKHSLARNHGIKTWSVRESDEEVVVAGVDRITGDTVEIGITIAQAKTAGWTSNEAYAKTPRDMLWARAMSRLLDRIAGDILFGLASFEDVVDAPDDRPTPTVTATVARPKAAEPGAGSAALRQLVADTTVAREAAVEVTKAAAPEAFPPVAEEPAPVPPVEEPPPAPPADAAGNVTRPQLSRISMLLGGRHGLGGPGSVAKRGRILSALVGRPLKTTQELTADEAVTVIGYLENTDTPALLAMADAPPAADPEPAGTGSDPWDEPAERDGTDQ